MKYAATTIAITLLLTTFGFDSAAGANDFMTDAGVSQALAQIAAGERVCSDLRVSWTEGDGVQGWTTVSIDNGRVVVRHRGIGRPDHWYMGRLQEDACRRLATLGASPELRKVAPSRSWGSYGETRPRIGFGIRGGSAWAVQQWRSDAQRNAKFASARLLLAELARDVSDGHVAIALK